ncbi:MAG: hypothetical protein BroJett020_22230 [Bacteroidota bacterium]|nr:MAG: hypothetical protein BroJett020_22230 [Bacteroidota bacterium]
MGERYAADAVGSRGATPAATLRIANQDRGAGTQRNPQVAEWRISAWRRRNSYPDSNTIRPLSTPQILG